MSDEMPPEEMPEVVWIKDERDGQNNIIDLECDCNNMDWCGGQEYLRADLAAPQWWNIETAPRDGTMVIVGYALDGEVLEVSQAQWVDKFSGCEELHGEWYDIDGIMYQDDVNVWMPLPKPNNL